jgi:hypothetical protein
MSTPAIVASIAGAFVVGVLLGMPLAYVLAKRRLAHTELLAPRPEPTLILEEIPVPKKPKHAATHVITSVGSPDTEPDGAPRTEFELRPQLNALAKGALVEVASLAHGVRSALTEENRAKIQYEIKRELIALRRTRKDEVKKALAEYRARHRAPVEPDSGEGV